MKARTALIIAGVVIAGLTLVVQWRTRFFAGITTSATAAALVDRAAWLASPGPLHAKHASLSTNCRACHAAFRPPPDAQCLGCHAGTTALLQRRATRFHAAAVACAGCHPDHRGRTASIVRMDHARLRPDVPCADCHVDRHAARFGATCENCHATEVWSVPGYRHPAATNTLCSECHAPPPSHLMMHFAMVDRAVTRQLDARVEQCWRCHTRDHWNEIRGIGFYKHH